jgi:hypothetical protein
LAGARSFAAIGEWIADVPQRVLAVLGALGYPAIDFPYAAHAFLIERYTTHHTSDRHSTYPALGITSLTGRYAHPTHIAAYARNHWHIENRPHPVRDVTYSEDHSRDRTDTAPRLMAPFRNLAISTLRHHARDNNAQSLRHIGRNPTHPAQNPRPNTAPTLSGRGSAKSITQFMGRARSR